MFDGNLLIPDWNPTDIRFASAGGGAVRGAVAVCLRRRGDVRGPRAGRLTRAFGAGRAAGWRRASIFFACTAAALPLPAEKAVVCIVKSIS